MGKLPPVQIIQIGYYTFAVICLVVVLSYLTCSITPFFRDFGQIINVILNVGMWATRFCGIPQQFRIFRTG